VPKIRNVQLIKQAKMPFLRPGHGRFHSQHRKIVPTIDIHIMKKRTQISLNLWIFLVRSAVTTRKTRFKIILVVACFAVFMAGKGEDSIGRKWKSVFGHIYLQNYPSPTSSQAHVFSLFKFVFFQEVFSY